MTAATQSGRRRYSSRKLPRGGENPGVWMLPARISGQGGREIPIFNPPQRGCLIYLLAQLILVSNILLLRRTNIAVR